MNPLEKAPPPPLPLSLHDHLTPPPPRDPQPPQPAFPQLPPRRAVQLPRLPLRRRRAARDLLLRTEPSIAQDAQRDEIDPRRDQAGAQDADHDEIRLAEAAAAGRGGVGGPALVQRVSRGDGAQIAEAGDEGGGGGDADFAVARLEDLVRPRHGYGHGGSEAETDD